MIEILLATYNGERYLRAQIDSLLSQTESNWKLLIHDDGSSDSTCEIIRSFQELYPEKINFIEDSIRTGGARNNFSHLLSFSSAPYVMFCDQDDVWRKDKIEITLRKMLVEERKNPGKAILIHSDLEVVDEDLNVVASSMFDYQRLPRNISSLSDMVVQNNVTGCTVMLNRKAVEVSLPIPSEAVMHDWWIACKVIQNSGVVGFIPNSLVLYRQHGNNAVGSKKVDVFHYFYRALNVREVFYSMVAVWRQARKIERGFGFLRFSFCKLRFVFKRLFL